MKKLLTLFLCAAGITALAQTPEQMIQQLPALPSAAEVIGHNKQVRQRMNSDNAATTPLPIDAFTQRVEAKMRQLQPKLQSQQRQEVNATVEAKMDSKVKGTNVTMRQASQMNEQQLQALAQQAVAGQLGNIGLNMSDLANISENMSEEEQNALTDKILAAQTGGLTQKDIKAMENMTDAQRAAYMKKRGLTTTPQQHQASSKATGISAQLAERIQKAQQGLLAAQQRFAAAKPISQAQAQGEQIYKSKYAARVQTLNQQFRTYIGQAESGSLSASAAEARERQLRQQRDAIEDQFFAEYIPIYRNAVAKMCDMARGDFLAAHKEYQAAFDEAYRLTGDAVYKLPSTYTAQSVEAYAESLLRINHYNLDSQGAALMQFEF